MLLLLQVLSAEGVGVDEHMDRIAYPISAVLILAIHHQREAGYLGQEEDELSRVRK